MQIKERTLKYGTIPTAKEHSERLQNIGMSVEVSLGKLQDVSLESGLGLFDFQFKRL